MEDRVSLVRIGLSIIIVAAIVSSALFLLSASKTLMNSGMENLNNGITDVAESESEVIAQKPEITKAPVEEKPQTVINNIDNSTTIVNESERPSYVVPVTVAMILGFILIMFDKVRDYKSKRAEETERILKTPLSTFGKEELNQLKSKYEE